MTPTDNDRRIAEEAWEKILRWFINGDGEKPCVIILTAITEAKKPQWFDAQEAATWPEGSVVLSRFPHPTYEYFYEISNWHRPDWMNAPHMKERQFFLIVARRLERERDRLRADYIAMTDDKARREAEYKKEIEVLRAQLAKRDEALKVAKEALSGLKSACVDVLLPAVNDAIKSGYKMTTWSPEAVQWSMATSDVDAALRDIEELTKEQLS